MTVFAIAAKAFPNSIRRRIKFLMRAFFHGKKYLREFEEIFSSPELHKILLDNPRQYAKIFRPYLFKGLKFSDRILWIRNHYEFTKINWSKKLIAAVYHERFLLLCSNIESSFFIALSRGMCYENEGEISLGIYNSGPFSKKVLSLSFNFTVDKNGEYGILIGCMQANSQLDAMQAMKNLTKKMHGLRPYALLMSIICEIASLYNIKKILAVTNVSHTRGKRIKTKLDVFWSDLGGVPIDNFYSLPLVYQRKLIELVSSNKRAMYKRRYAILDNLLGQVNQVLSQDLNAINHDQKKITID